MQENQMQYPLDLLLQTRMVLLQINLKAKASGEKIEARKFCFHGSRGTQQSLSLFLRRNACF